MFVGSPPEGCLQYHTGLSGTFQTFNFPDATTSHLANQQYSVCIRQELGYCCVEYQVCPDPMSFSIGTQDQINPDPDNEQECYEDYLLIEGSDVNCRAETAGSLLLNRYCGLFFNDDRRADTDENGIVCGIPLNISQLLGVLKLISIGRLHTSVLYWSSDRRNRRRFQ